MPFLIAEVNTTFSPASMHKRGSEKSKKAQWLEAMCSDLCSGKPLRSFTINLLKTQYKGELLQELLLCEPTLTEEQRLNLRENNQVAQIFGNNLCLQDSEPPTRAVLTSFIGNYLVSRLDFFTCPITMQLINQPLSYSVNGIQHVFEQSQFRQSCKGFCPTTREPFENLDIIELDKDIEHQIERIRPFLKMKDDDVLVLTQEEIEAQLTSKEKFILVWIQIEALQAMELNDSRRVDQFVEQLPLLKYLIAPENQVRNQPMDEEKDAREDESDERVEGNVSNRQVFFSCPESCFERVRAPASERACPGDCVLS